MKKKKFFSPAHRLNLSKALLNKRKSRATKEKISIKMLGHKVLPSTRAIISRQQKEKLAYANAFIRHRKLKHQDTSPVDRRRRYRECFVCHHKLHIS